jgi:hypothetical protein
MTAGWSATRTLPKGQSRDADQHFSPQGVGEAGDAMPKGHSGCASPEFF